LSGPDAFPIPASRIGLPSFAPYYPEVIARLPLDSPLWEKLSACYSRENAIARLREVMETRELGAAWKSLLGEIQH